MSRLPELDPEKFSPEQKKVHEAILAGPRGRVVGPLKVWLKNPGLAEHAQALGAYCRFNSSLPPRLSELAICVTGSHWKANYEWFAHAPLAIKAGIDPAAIEAIRTGATPKFTKSDEQAIYDFASELVKTKRVSARRVRARQEGTRRDRRDRYGRHHRLLQPGVGDAERVRAAAARRRAVSVRYQVEASRIDRSSLRKRGPSALAKELDARFRGE